MDKRRLALKQPLAGIVTSAIAASCLLAVWGIQPPAAGSVFHTLFMAGLACSLASALYLATRFPVHVRHQVKMEMGTVPLYLMAVLLPPSLAALAAGAGLAACEWALRKQRGHHLGDIASQAGRWALIDLAGSFFAHTAHPAFTAIYLATLILTAGILLIGDIITVPFQISAINGEPVSRLVLECLRGAGITETGQYGIGILGGLVAIIHPACVLFLLLPLTAVYRLAKRAKELHEKTRLELENLADEVDSRDAFTHEHSKRVTAWTRKLLPELNVAGPEAYLIVTAARVHDIGKLFIPEKILHKHEKLEPEEWTEMEKHPGIGADMLERYPAFARGAAIVRGHHERWDGQGYPDGLSGTTIPFGARLLAVADSFDAMTSDRPYRQGMPIERAAAILSGGKGIQWDAAIVDAFLRLIASEPIATVSPLASPLPAV